MSIASRLPWESNVVLEAAGAAPARSDTASIKMKKSVEYWYRKPDGILPNYSEENPSQCHFAHHKTHRDREVFERVLSRWN